MRSSRARSRVGRRDRFVLDSWIEFSMGRGESEEGDGRWENKRTIEDRQFGKFRRGIGSLASGRA